MFNRSCHPKSVGLVLSLQILCTLIDIITRHAFDVRLEASRAPNFAFADCILDRALWFPNLGWVFQRFIFTPSVHRCQRGPLHVCNNVTTRLAANLRDGICTCLTYLDPGYRGRVLCRLWLCNILNISKNRGCWLKSAHTRHDGLCLLRLVLRCATRPVRAWGPFGALRGQVQLFSPSMRLRDTADLAVGTTRHTLM